MMEKQKEQFQHIDEALLEDNNYLLAKNIQDVLSRYQNSDFDINDCNPYEEMSGLLDHFFTDKTTCNNENVLLRGTDFCEMLGLFFDFADVMNGNI